jgi:hypothetical protein
LVVLAATQGPTAQGRSTVADRNEAARTPQDLTAQDLAAVQTFDERVTRYVASHRMLEQSTPALRPTANVHEIQEARRALRIRIQKARHNAKQGDIITPEVALMFRRRIASCLAQEAWAALMNEMAQDEQGRPVAVPRLRVNSEWPAEALFNFVPPELLLVLPPLPPELEYHIIGRALVLFDMHADLIVDALPDAFTS